MNLLVVPIICGSLALIVNVFIVRGIPKKDTGDKVMKEIVNHIEEGALAFLKKEYVYLAVFIVIVFIAILLFFNIQTAIHFQGVLLLTLCCWYLY